MSARKTSIESYYSRIVTPGVELRQIDQIVLYVLNHPCCTRRQIAAAHTGALNQEARVSARVKAALDRGLIVESPSPIKDEVTGAEAYPLYPVEKQRELALVFDHMANVLRNAPTLPEEPLDGPEPLV